MKMKKKLLIALLSVTCMTAGVFGLAACKNNNADEGDAAIRAIYNQYVVYAETNGDEVLSYEQWLDSIKGAQGPQGIQGEKGDQGEQGEKGDQGEPGVGIAKIEATADGDLLITYTNGETYVVAMPKTYTAYAEDLSGNPVANAYFTAYYLDSNYFAVEVGYARSNSKGVATFSFIPEKGKTYYLKLTDPDKITSGDSNTPEGYELSLGTLNGLKVTSTTFDDNRETYVTFKNVKNSFSNAISNGNVLKIPYTRAYDFDTDTIVETNGTENNSFTIKLTAGTYTYALLSSPYVSPELPDYEYTPDPSDDEETAKEKEEAALEAYKQVVQDMLDKALEASTGIYRVTVTGGNVVMYSFSGSVGYTPADENGIPSIIKNITGEAPEDAENASLYTGTNYIDFELNAYYSRADQILAFVAASDCTVTVTVERIADAPMPETPPTDTVYPPETLTQYGEPEDGSVLNLMPINGSLSVSLGGDGYYHVGSTTGPVLLVQLNEVLERVGEFSISELPDVVIDADTGTTYGNSIFTFLTVDENNNPVYKDYLSVVQAYSACANSDGVIAVDGTIANFLKLLAAKGIGLDIFSAESGYEWLLYCQYYSPAGGIVAPGSGTDVDPYALIEGANMINILSGSDYAQFEPAKAGVYAISTSSSAVYASYYGTDYEVLSISGTLYVRVSEDDIRKPFTFFIEGLGVGVTVRVNAVTTVEAVYDGEGFTESEAIEIAGIQIINVNVNTAVADGVYIKFCVPFGADGEYSFDLSGNTSAKIVYNGKEYTSSVDPLVINCVYGSTYTIYLTSVGENGNPVSLNYILNIEKSVPILHEGDDEIVIDDTFTPYTYSFIASVSGYYTLTIPNGELVYVTYPSSDGTEIDMIDAFSGINYGIFYLAAGQKISFNFTTYYNTGSIAVNIAQGIPQNDPLVLNEKQAIPIFPKIGSETIGYDSTITVTESGTYSFLFASPGSASETYSITINGQEYTEVIKTGSSYEIQLTAGVNTVRVECTSSDTKITGIELTITKSAE